RTLADAVRVVDRAGRPEGAVLVDALHLQRSGGTPADVAALAPQRLPYCQLCDAPAEPVWSGGAQVLTEAPADALAVALTEARTGRLMPGDGELPLRDLVDALPPDAALA